VLDAESRLNGLKQLRKIPLKPINLVLPQSQHFLYARKIEGKKVEAVVVLLRGVGILFRGCFKGKLHRGRVM
jgi:hypothetical protein